MATLIWVSSHLLVVYRMFSGTELLRHRGKGACSFTQSNVQMLHDKDVGDNRDGVGDGVGDKWEGGEVCLERK